MEVQQTTCPSGATSPRRRYVSGSRESVRMFRRDWMEALSKVYWWVPAVVYGPVIAWLLIYAFVFQSVPALPALGWFVFGVVTWTLVEYVMHRWIFHYKPRVKWGQRLHFIFHGVHHDYPNDAHRLVMPPTASLPIAFAFYGLFSLIVPAAGLYACVAGFLAGYMIYDLIHYALHHASWKARWFAVLKRNHMKHHFAEPERRYGVTSAFWDHVFGTQGR
jgi:sterol desaturase/sphingolipid hydroxylase (fatty acid hydroxylase superfamily)